MDMDREEEEVARLLQPRTRESGLLLDREGKWWHENEPVDHERLKAALHRWIDRDEESGRFIIRAGQQWCFIDVEDAPFIVLGIVVEGTKEDLSITLRLSDGTEEELDYGSLRQNSRNVLYSDAKGGRFKARFSRTAYFRLAELVEIEDDKPVLRAGGAAWPIVECDE